MFRKCKFILLVLISYLAYSKEVKFEYKYIKCVDSNDIKLIDKKFIKSDTNIIFKQISDLYRNQGYLLATIFKFNFSDDTLIIYVNKNQRFNYFNLKLSDSSNLPLKVIKTLNTFCSSQQKLNAFKKLQFQLSEFYSNNGYPFYEYKFDSITINKDSINAFLVINSNFLIHFDSLVILQPIKSQNQYLQLLTGVKKGMIYDQSKVDNIDKIILKSNLFELKSKPYVIFKFDKAYVYLDIVEKKSSYINGLIGLSQQPSTQKNILIGEFQYKTRNLLGQGIKWEVAFKKFQLQSQQAKTQLAVPYLFKSNLGVDASIVLLKQDTSFVNVSRNFNFLLTKANSSKIGLLFQFNSSSVNSKISSEKNTLVSNSSKLYGLSYQFNTLIQNNFISQNGFGINLEGRIGNKIINNADSLTKTTTQYLCNIEFKKFIKINKMLELRSNIQCVRLYNNKNILLLNELYRIGGSSDVRGFNEKQFFANFFAIHNLDFRLLLGQESGINLFTDVATFNNNNSKIDFNNLLGFGIGTFIKTQIGYLQVQYALGKANQEIVNLASSKIHISLSSDW